MAQKLLSKLALLFAISIAFTAFPGEPAAAQNLVQKADSLQKTINVSIKTENTVDDIADLLFLLSDLNESRKGIEWSKLGIEIAEEIEYDRGKQNILINVADHYFATGNVDSAGIMLDRAALLETKIENRIRLLNSRGQYYGLSQQYIEAIEQYEQLAFLADSIGNLASVAAAKNNLGLTYSRLGDNYNTLKNYYEALEISEKLNDSTRIAIGLNNVGLLFNEMGNYEQAEYFLYRSQSLSEQLGLQSNLIRTIVNIGALEKNRGNLDLAEKNHLRAKEMLEKLSNTPGIVRADYNLGMIEVERQNYDQAIEYLSSALEQSQRINFPPGLYYSSRGMGILEYERDNVEEAISWFMRASNIAERMRLNDGVLDSYDQLYESNKKAGNPEEALRWLEKYNALSDSIRSAEKDRLVTEYEARFSIKESQQQNQLLEARQQQQLAQLETQKWFLISSFAGLIFLLGGGLFLVRSSYKRKKANNQLQESNLKLSQLNSTVQNQNRELEELNNIKTKLFAIIAHDLRGPLSSLQSLFALIREHDLSKEEVQKMSNALEISLQENTNLLDNLLAWAKSQMNGITINKRSFNLLMCVGAIYEQYQYQTDQKNIRLDIQVPEDLKIYADYDIFKLVIRNLLANAVKFSQNNSLIEISAGKDDGHVHLYIKDEGVGIPVEHQSKIFNSINFTSNGTDNEKGSGLGLSLCKEFITRHDGEIWFESEPGSGTTFFIRMPVHDSISAEKEVVEL